MYFSSTFFRYLHHRQTTTVTRPSKYRLTIALWCFALLGTAGCTDRAPVSAPDTGRNAVVEMEIRPQKPSEITRAGGHDDQCITSLYFLIFGPDGNVQTRERVTYTESRVRLKTCSGRNRIAVVANADAELTSRLAAVGNSAQFDEVQATARGTAMPDDGLLMFGEAQADLHPDRTNNVEIPLSFVGAKITFRINSNLPYGESITINSCTAVNLPSGSFLAGRETDADPKTTLSPQPVLFTKNSGKQYSGDLYLFENRRGRRPLAEGEAPAQAILNKRLYAPEGASCLIVSATHHHSGGSGTFDIFLYFGQDNATDYTVNRAEHHTYTVTVNGFNQVNIDSNIDYEANTFTVTYGDNLRMDSHPDFRPMRVGASSGRVAIDVTDAEGRSYSDPGFSAGWLRLSPIDLMKHQVRQSDPEIARWQQAGDLKSFVRGRYIPHRRWREQLGTPVWNDLPGASEDDDEMAFDRATRRMCYRLTGLEFGGQRTSQDFFVYADANESNEERYARITVTRYPASGSEAPQTQSFNISQDAPLYIGTSADGHRLYVESYEEASTNLYPGAPEQLRATKMQWGYNYQELYSGADKYTDGAFLTVNSVYRIQRAGDGSYSWRDAPYREKYSSFVDTKIIEPYNNRLSDPVYAYPDYTVWERIYSPVYGSSAARHCHEKNRDLNGDGIIDESETVWYMPSIQELQQIWLATNSIPSDKRPVEDEAWGENIYMSSTEQDRTSVWTFAFGKGYTDNSRPKSKQLLVRCVRRESTAGLPEVSAENGRIILDNHNMPEHSIALGHKGAGPSSAKSNLTLASRLQVASRDLNGLMVWHEAMGYSYEYGYTMANDAMPTQQTGCRSYSEASNGSDRGAWRLPTSRELLRIWMLRDQFSEIKGGNFARFKEEPYWSATENEAHNSMAVNMSFAKENNARIIGHSTAQRSSRLRVRCVREL